MMSSSQNRALDTILERLIRIENKCLVEYCDIDERNDSDGSHEEESGSDSDDSECDSENLEKCDNDDECSHHEQNDSEKTDYVEKDDVIKVDGDTTLTEYSQTMNPINESILKGIFKNSEQYQEALDSLNRCYKIMTKNMKHE